MSCLGRCASFETSLVIEMGFPKTEEGCRRRSEGWENRGNPRFAGSLRGHSCWLAACAPPRSFVTLPSAFNHSEQMDSPEVNYTHLNISTGYWTPSPTTLDFNSAHYDGNSLTGRPPHPHPGPVVAHTGVPRS